MTVEDDRAIQYLKDQGRILLKRQAFARGLMAPPGPRLRVKAAWAPLLRDPGNPVLSERLATPPAIVPPVFGATFTGHGPPPDHIDGAVPGSTYLDLDTGDLYQLGV